MKHTFFHRNEKLRTIKEGWRGNAMRKGRFENLDRNSSSHGMKSILKWKFGDNPDRKIKRKERWNPEVSLLTSLKDISDESLVWLGHNSFFLKLGGKRVLLDPVFGDIPFMKRKSKFPASKRIFTNIDFILLSHDHYDHLDKRSIKQVAKRSPRLKIICGLGVGEVLKKWVSQKAEIIEAGWYQQHREGELKITFLPSKHWSKRGATDSAKRLWGAFMIQSPTKSIYYSGDTGYDTHFEEISELFGEPDYALIGIGAYKPRWFMKPNHISPYDAVKAAKIMGAKRTIPMHYGTFDLSAEPLSDPPKVFKEEAEKSGIDIEIPKLGEVLRLE